MIIVFTCQYILIFLKNIHFLRLCLLIIFNSLFFEFADLFFAGLHFLLLGFLPLLFLYLLLLELLGSQFGVGFFAHSRSLISNII